MAVFLFLNMFLSISLVFLPASSSAAGGPGAGAPPPTTTNPPVVAVNQTRTGTWVDHSHFTMTLGNEPITFYDSHIDGNLSYTDRKSVV